jgi:hypothetical protein
MILGSEAFFNDLAALAGLRLVPEWGGKAEK